MRGFISSCLTHTLPPTVSGLHNHLLSSILQADLLYVPRIRVKHRCINALPRRIRRLQNLRQSLFAKYRHTQLECDRLAFRKVRNKCRFEIRKYKAQSQLRTLQISRDNPKYLYKYMRRQRQSSPSPWPSNSQTALQPTPPPRWLKPSGNISTVF